MRGKDKGQRKREFHKGQRQRDRERDREKQGSPKAGLVLTKSGV